MDVFGYSPWGYSGDLVRVEVDLRRGIPGVEIVGLPGNAVREARERVRIALRRAGFEFPTDRVLINLAPADLPKQGSGFDLPIALALLHASGQWTPDFGTLLAMGELALDGGLRRVPGILAGTQEARRLGVAAVAVAHEAGPEAASAGPGPLAAAGNLAGLVSALQSLPNPAVAPSPEGPPPPNDPWILRGQETSVAALEACAAGGHSLLLYGPPGAGKSLAARHLPSLLDPLEPEASQETTRLWSLAGILPRQSGLLVRRPFRAPHHLTTAEGLLGGGKPLGPGEVSLAHHGVLFLDEAPEFAPRVLQSLREPLEQGMVTVVRAGRSAWFPSRFQLLMTANACPCGQTGRPGGLCLCSGQEIRRYWDRIGSPLMDRVDLRVFVQPESAVGLLASPATDPHRLVGRIARARERQRLRGQSVGLPNAALGPRELESWVPLTPAAQRVLADRSHRFQWSARAIHAVLRLTRTLADLDDHEAPHVGHLETACGLRQPSGELYWER